MCEERDKLKAFAEKLADSARVSSLKYFRKSIDIDNKQDSSPVTKADRETEKLLREMILKSFPNHGIYGEEFGVENIDAESVWVIDPIDGTASFITGVPMYGTLISLIKNSKPLLGLIDIPAQNERWIATSNQSTYYNGKLCLTSHCTELSSAKLLSTTPDMFTSKELSTFNKLSQKVYLRRFGGDCYCYGLLASGHIDLVVESDLKPYDYMALVPVVEGAGGVITDWQGNALTIHSGPGVVAAATQILHQQAIEQLNDL